METQTPGSNGATPGPSFGHWMGQWIGDALGLSVRFPDRAYTLITSDSRKARPDSLFVALPGDQFDGHDFITKAIEGGASAILASKSKLPRNLPADIEIFAVEDSLEGYRALAHAWRKRLKIPFVMVAGSVGKTTTKELLSSILRGKWANVFSTEGSQNGYVGIPMTILSIPETADVAVIEVGIDEPGAMKKHIELVEPTHSLLTAIGPEHLERLIDLETVAREEGYALQVPARSGATLVVRMDDPWIKKISEKLPREAHVWDCSLGSEFEGKVALLDKTLRGEYLSSKEALRVILANGSGYELPMPLPGAHNAGNLLVAVTMAMAMELTPIEIQRGLSSFRTAFGRSDLRILPGKTPVLCDYYNANPTSVEAALDLLASVAQKYGSPRRVAILGDMLELGTQEEALHRALAGKITATGVDRIYLFGDRMRWLADELAKTGRGESVRHFDSQSALGDTLAAILRPGEAILIKGSRGMKMEEVWKRISPVLDPVGSAVGA